MFFTKIETQRNKKYTQINYQSNQTIVPKQWGKERIQN